MKKGLPPDGSSPLCVSQSDSFMNPNYFAAM